MMQCVENLLFGKKKKETDKKQTSSLKQGSIVWWVRVVIVFCLVSMAWCFFRAGSVTQAVWILAHSLQGITQPFAYIKTGLTAFDKSLLLQLLLPVALLGCYDYVALSSDPITSIGRMKKPIRYAIYYTFVFALLLLASFNSQEFVYFQF